MNEPPPLRNPLRIAPLIHPISSVSDALLDLHMSQSGDDAPPVAGFFSVSTTSAEKSVFDYIQIANFYSRKIT